VRSSEAKTARRKPSITNLADLKRFFTTSEDE
jgi:hypothetical protein